MDECESMRAGALAMDSDAPAPARWSPPWAGRGALAPSDVLAVLWRSWPMMLAIFLVVAALGIAAALSMHKKYTATSSLLVRLGQEYVYNPRVGDAARGAVPEVDQVIQSEVEILNSPVLKERAIADIGLAKIAPKAAAAYAHADAVKRREILGGVIKSMETGFKVATAPDTAVVRLSYTDRDPQMAATILNTLIDEYLSYRKSVLSDRDAAAIGDQRHIFEGQLADVDARYRKLLADNGVSDFDTEKTSLGQIAASLLTESYAVQAQLSETEGRLGATAVEVARAPAQIGLYQDVDHLATDKLTQLRLDRQDLLGRYRADAQPVRDIDEKITALSQANASGGTLGPGARRVGINPVYQTLQTDRAQLQAQAASLRSRKAAIATELTQIGARRARLADIEPQYLDLARQRDALTNNVKSFTQREQESQAEQALAQRASDNVRVVQRAFIPTKGTSLKQPVMLLSLVLAAAAALAAGLLRVFLERGFPSAAAAERALGLPVLATARAKRVPLRAWA